MDENFTQCWKFCFLLKFEITIGKINTTITTGCGCYT